MGKKVVIGVLAVLGLIAVSQTTADALTCLSWKTIGGSSMCVAYATKGVQVAITFRDGCFVQGEGGAFVDCTATASAFTTDSFAFCSNGATTPSIVKVACSQQFNFATLTPINGTGCVEHADSESVTGEANEHHRCVSSATLTRAETCNPCCNPGTNPAAPAGFPVCVDLTPVEMQTHLEAFGPGGAGASCSAGSGECTVEQDCTINPKKIAFITDPSQGKEYQCNITCVGPACFGD
jgi:hypothetical protein